LIHQQNTGRSDEIYERNIDTWRRNVWRSLRDHGLGGAMSVYAYLRVSTDEQASGTSLDTQRREVEGNALTHNLVIDQFIEDAGVSGHLGFIGRLAANGVTLKRGDVVIVAKLDRFSRNSMDTLNVVHEFKRDGIRLIINGHGDVTDEKNIYGQLMLEIMAAFATHERRVIKDRQRTGQAAKKSQGGHVGGKPPFGYAVDGSGKSARLIPVPEQQEALETIKSLAGLYSLRIIAWEVGRRHGVKVSHTAIQKVINRGCV
jgi:DNA invertase Pin-like site-specific DNA recombinase